MTGERTLRILHAVERMDRAGLETWLMNVLRHIDRKHFKMDFLTNTTDCCDYDDEIRALGSRIIPCMNTQRPLSYKHNFNRILHQFGPYDFVHSHFRHYSGWVLRLAYGAEVPCRILHIHSDISTLKADAVLLRRAYMAMMGRWINQYATVGFACSKASAAAFLGSAWQSDPRWRIHYCGTDIAPFETPADPVSAREQLGIPSDAFVVGHLGRFAKMKNHSFLLNIAAETIRHAPSVRFLLIGDGALLLETQAMARSLNIDKHIVFTGNRSDAPRLMLSAMDAFLFPSLFEGLPLALIEAQAAGLPCVISDSISEEADVVDYLINRISLSQPAAIWAESLLHLLRAKAAAHRARALPIVKESPFNILSSVKELEKLYLSFVQSL